MEYRNAAGRLLSILSPPDKSSLLSLREDIPRLLQLRELYSDFRDDVHRDDIWRKQEAGQSDIILRGLKRIETDISNATGEGIGELTPAEVSLLELSARRIPEEGDIYEYTAQILKEAPVSDEQLERRFKAEEEGRANDLYVDFYCANLRRLLRNSKKGFSTASQMCVRRFNGFCERAMENYDFHGARGIRRASKAMLGEIIEAYATASDKKELKENPAWIAMIELFQLVDKLASSLLSCTQLGLDVIPKLFGDEHN